MIEELIIEGDFSIRGKGLSNKINTKHLKYLKLSTRLMPMIEIDAFSSIDKK